VAAAAHFDSAQGRSARPVAQPPPTATRANPDTDPRAATARKLCGVCHPFETIVSIRRTRSQWEATVENMISRGARGTSAEFASVVAFLAESYGLNAPPNRGGAGPDDKPLVDSKAAEMGRPVYGENCVACHGGDARGTATGSNLVRSLVVLHDRYGSTLGPYLRASHPPVPIGGQGSQTGPKFEALTNTQVLVLAHFLRERVNDTLRGAPMFKPGNVLTGAPRAGAEYFNGEGGCAKCHSPTGDLAGIGKRLEPVNLQQRFLFPANAARQSAAGKAKTVTVTVTSESGETLSGELDRMDDFNVSFRDASGAYHSVRRTAGTRVVKNDPFAAHVDLLARITDKNIHDVVAYLETLK
jgi:mono/diheme cytochrome c family protein